MLGAAAGGVPAGTSYDLVFVPGDGIGPEVIAAGRRVLEATGRIFGFGLRWREVLIGGVAIDAYGVPMRDEDLEVCRAADAVYFGSIGDPRFDDPSAKVRPEQALLGLRKGLGLYANLRPVSVQPVLRASSPVREALLEGVDMLIVRELTGGLYFGKSERVGDSAYDTMLYSEAECDRLLEYAFGLAARRGGLVHSVDKANVLESSRLWRAAALRAAARWPAVEVRHMLVDNCAMQLIREPRQFDVIATENLFGDILSDEAAMLTGSIGMLPSASVGAGGVSLYEPIHGSAPDIAGRGIVNPCATILSAAMMLDLSFGQTAAARAVEAAVETALAGGARTADIAAADEPTITTDEMTDRVIAAL